MAFSQALASRQVGTLLVGRTPSRDEHDVNLATRTPSWSTNFIDAMRRASHEYPEMLGEGEPAMGRLDRDARSTSSHGNRDQAREEEGEAGRGKCWYRCQGHLE